MNFEKLNRFLDTFPNDAKSWANATDELRDLCRSIRESINEQRGIGETSPGAYPALNFRELKTPSQWNTEAKKYILNAWPTLTPVSKEYIFNFYNSWFK